MHREHVESGLGDFVGGDGEERVGGCHPNRAEGGGAGRGEKVFSLMISGKGKKHGLHVGHLLEVALFQQRKKGAGDEVGAGDVGGKCRFKVGPMPTGQLEARAGGTTT